MVDITNLGSIQIKGSDGSERLVRFREGQTLALGRGKDCDIVISEPGVSRHHATITATSNGVVIFDNASTNGTFVNGEKLTALQDIQGGDIIDIGGSKLTLKLKSTDAANSLSGETASRAMTAQLSPLAVNVLVVSVQDYDEMKEELPPEDLEKMLDIWKSSVRKIVAAFQGTVDKIVGSRVVVIWKSHDSKKYAIQAVQTAIKLRMLGKSPALKKAWKHEEKHPWTNTVVIGTGIGLEGVLGSVNGENSFTVLGDPVNLAFKLEELVGKLGQNLIIEESTAELIKGEFKLEKVIRVKIKGSDQQKDIYTLPEK